MQMATAGFVTQRVEHEHGNVNVEFFAVFGHAKVAAVHGAGGRAKARAAGVFKLLAGLQQGLMADDPQATNFFMQARGVVHVPGARDELRSDGAHIGNRDGVGEHVHAALWV